MKFVTLFNCLLIIFTGNFLIIKSNFINVNAFATNDIILQTLLLSFITTLLITLVIIVLFVLLNIVNNILEMIE